MHKDGVRKALRKRSLSVYDVREKKPYREWGKHDNETAKKRILYYWKAGGAGT